MNLQPFLNTTRHLFFYCVLAVLLQSCSLMGLHINLHNPKKPGEFPKFSEEAVLLGALTKYRSCFDVTYYDLSVTIDPDRQFLKGKVLIYATAVQDFDTLQIDLHPNLAIKKLADHSSQKDLSYKRIERAVMVTNAKKKGDHFIIEVDYEGKPMVAKKAPWEGGFVWKKDANGNPWVGVACESDGASIWWPLKDHTSDEPDSVRMHYTVPANLVAVGNGQLEGKTETGKEVTYNWFVSYPINTYNVTVYVGKFVSFGEDYVGVNNRVLKLDYYVMPAHLDIAKEEFKLVPKVLRTFEESFGAYPWYRDGYKLIESPFLGMEHQTAIAFGDGYGSREHHAFTADDDIIVHETAHEWWGNSVTAKDFADVWLQEGFATYAEVIFQEKKGDTKAMNNILMLHRLVIQNKLPVVGVADRRWFHYKKSADVYSKGAWILHTLRQQLKNDDLFFDILKSFQEHYRYQLVDSKDFVNWVSKKAGQDYSWFFKQYLNHNLVPELEYTISKTGMLYYKWSKVENDFDKLRVSFDLMGSKLEIVPAPTLQKVQLPKLENDVWMLQFNPQILAIYKSNKKLVKD